MVQRLRVSGLVREVRASRFGRAARTLAHGSGGDATRVLVKGRDHEPPDREWIAYRQTECLAGLYALLAPDHPLPAMRRYAISPDCGLELAQQVLREDVTTVVEFGCGTSTVITALALRRAGRGHLHSFEHSSHWAGVVEEALALHGVSDYVTMEVAPLAPLDERDLPPSSIEVAGASDKPPQWYGVRELPDAIDLVFVDGPPGGTCRLARYPALPRVADELTPGAVVLVDDANRPAETAMVRQWQVEYPQMEVERLDFEFGAVRCTWPPSPG